MSNLFPFFEQVIRDRWSGQMTLISTQGRCIIRCVEGHLLFAHKAIDRTLQRWERLDWLKVPEAHTTDQNSWASTIRALWQANPSEWHRLQWLLLTDRKETFLRAFFWTNVEIRENSHPAPLEEFSEFSFYPPLDMAELLREARQRLKDWPAMKAKIGSSKKVFVSLVPRQDIPSQMKHALKNKMIASHDDDKDFSWEDLELLRHCDGSHSLNDIVQIFPQGEFAVIKAILRLENRGALKAKEDIFQEGSTVRLLSLSVNDAFNSVILTLSLLTLLSLLSFGLNVRMTHPCQTRSLQQALELYRSATNHYPLTLNDLPRAVRIDQSAFSYSLLNPVSYKLGCQSTEE